MEWDDTPFWIAFGLLGQGAFFTRFLIQWVASERARRSYVPMAFWYLSLLGSLVLLVYALHRREPIFFLGYLPNSFVYVRNIMLSRRGGDEEGAASAPPPPGGPGR